MATLHITDIDITPYQTTPLLPTEATLTLGLDLHSCMPANAPEHVQKAGKRMLNTANEIKQVFITRVELAGIELGMQSLFDNAVDRFWVALRRQCSLYMIYAHEGLDMLSDEEQAQIDLADKREKAELARELDKHLFGIDGLKFLGKPWNEQVVLMGSRLAFIAASDKVSAFEAVIGPDLLNTLNVLQGRYEAMVRDRSSRDDEGANIKALRHTLQRHISLYASAVLSLLDDDEPDSIEMVLDALRPMVNARSGRRTKPAAASADSSAAEAEGQPPPNNALEPPLGPVTENDDN